MELAPHDIRVLCISPGLIEVFEEENLTPRYVVYINELMKTIPMGHSGRPRDIGDVAVFLASDGARYMTGSIVRVDGGAGAGRFQLPLQGLQ